jgi:hypothetical protein
MHEAFAALAIPDKNYFATPPMVLIQDLAGQQDAEAN